MEQAAGLSSKEKFLKIYANLPIGVRTEIISVLPEIGPVTWNSAYIEINTDSHLSKKILDELDLLEII
jgi:hypothetical protein